MSLATLTACVGLLAAMERLNHDSRDAPPTPENGSTLHVRDAMKGTRVTKSAGRLSYPADPEGYGVKRVSTRRVSDRNQQLTPENDGGTATNLTKRDGGSADQVEHQAGTALPNWYDHPSEGSVRSPLRFQNLHQKPRPRYTPQVGE